jgi:hypothetical protein
VTHPPLQVTGDKKTPAEAKDFCEASAKEFGIECIYQTPDDQVEWLKKYPELGEEIPWNSIQRRNLAILLAYEKGCDVIITIDDDNYFIEGQDFVGEHAAPILNAGEHVALKSNTDWLNVCEFLEVNTLTHTHTHTHAHTRTHTHTHTHTHIHTGQVQV